MRTTPLLHLAPEERAVQGDGCEADDGGQACEGDEHEVERELVRVELDEPRLERQREQEPADELRAREGDPQLLQDVVPVAVASLVRCLVPAVIGVGVAIQGARAVAWRWVGRIGVARAGVASVHVRS